MGNFIKKFLKVLKFEIKREVKETFRSVNDNNLLSTNNTKIQHYLSPLMIEQDEISKKMDTTSDSNGAISNGNENGGSGRNNGLPDLVNQKGNNDSTDKARKYLEGLDGVKFNEIQVPDQLKKQLEYFDRDELLQLIAYQKKYLDFKESRIKDLENYIDNLVVKIIEKEPSILMNASNVLSKSRNLI